MWLWRIAAWSMGLSLLFYGLLAFSGIRMRSYRQRIRSYDAWLRPFHILSGIVLLALVLGLLAIGIVGTLGEYGTLGHSAHLPIGLLVVGLTLLSAWSATRIGLGEPGARSLHITINLTLLLGFLFVLATGWSVVQKYLPE
nr:DUF4079 domain-containing protein [Leptolyngbya sp. FACHB-8]